MRYCRGCAFRAAYVITQIVFDTIEERFTNQLIEAGKLASELMVREALGEAAVGTITPHSFRHYFVTAVLRATGGDIHTAQRLARHSNISVTERYAHLSDDELDRTYHQVFNEE